MFPSRYNHLVRLEAMSLPKLPTPSLQANYQRFVKALNTLSFTGEIHTDYATRMALSTDNSIYQLIPEVVLYPKSHEDVAQVLKLAGDKAHQHIQLSPRAGGTGTDGQSLTPGIILDCSKHLREILNLDLEKGTVTVQPGVVLDQLNAYLKPHGVFFAPSCSTSNRACIGGMFNTDACGLGSAKYGRTSEHVLSVKAVLIGGEVLQTKPLDFESLAQLKLKENQLGNIVQQVDELVTHKADLIDKQFPKMRRFMTGYNLPHIRQNNQFDLTKLLSGSEGTLAYITELTLKLTALPTAKTLMAVKYRDFDTALRAGYRFLDAAPTCIESIDDKIIKIARKDEIWLRVKPMLECDGPDTETQAINLIEWSEYDETQLESTLDAVEAQLKQDPNIVGYYRTQNDAEIATWWELRKKSVGLLANLPGKRQPVPFVEDTAVPPEKLADFIRDFCAILDEHNLTYGMFGHVDAGCIHVRPALDMTDPEDAKLIKTLSKAIQDLTLQYGGVLWGEHGSGFRSEYLPDYFGEELYQDMRQIKALFDPHNQLNPGKVVSAAGTEQGIVKVGEQLRADRDGQVPSETREKLFKAFKCNGNAICMNVMPDLAICPSYKVSKDRVHSPKGRAVLMREWLTQLAKHNIAPEITHPNGRAKADSSDFSHQVYQAFSGCLGCKSCALSCPVQVDIPNLRAQFLNSYHQRYAYSLRDRLLIDNEKWLLKQSRHPLMYRALKPISDLFLKSLGLLDTPAVATNPLKAQLKQAQIPVVQSPTQARECDVLLVQDALTSFIEPKLVIAACQVLRKINHKPGVLAFHENGKAKHNKGQLPQFESLARHNAKHLEAFEQNLLGIEPSFTLAYRDEYKNTLGKALPVELFSEWLAKQDFQFESTDTQPYYLLAHCSERALAPKSESLWQIVFAKFGLKLEIVPVGCCGMAGSYGHEKEHVAHSQKLFEMSWQPKLNELPSERVLATGFSCRSQVKRFAGLNVKHPLMVLA